MQLSVGSACKVIATVGLGGIAAFHTQLAATKLPALHSTTRRTTIAQDAQRPTEQLQLLSAASASFSALLIVVYALSERPGRHPYLSYVAGVSLLSSATAFLGTGKILRVLTDQALAIDGALEQVKARFYELFKRSPKQVTHAKQGPVIAAGEMNGEILEAALVRAGRLAWVDAGLSILAFALSLAGNLGDRY